MSALNRRLLQGLDALREGNLEMAVNRLDEVANVPGEARPVPGLSSEAEERFYTLLGGIHAAREEAAVAQSAWDEDRYESSADLQDDGWLDAQENVVEAEVVGDDAECGCALSVSVTTMPLAEPVADTYHESSFYHDPDTGSFVDRVHEVSQLRTTELEVSTLDAPAIVDTISTVETTTTSVVYEGETELPDEVLEGLGWAPDESHQWDECHIEEVRVLRTTLIYRGDSEAPPALPCTCSEHDEAP